MSINKEVYQYIIRQTVLIFYKISLYNGKCVLDTEEKGRSFSEKQD